MVDTVETADTVTVTVAGRELETRGYHTYFSNFLGYLFKISGLSAYWSASPPSFPQFHSTKSKVAGTLRLKFLYYNDPPPRGSPGMGTHNLGMSGVELYKPQCSIHVDINVYSETSRNRPSHERTTSL